MTILDVQFESSQGTAHVKPGGSEKFLLCDGEDEDGKNVIIMDKVFGAIEHYRDNIHTVGKRGKVLKKSRLGDQLFRTVLIDASNDSLKLDLACGSKPGGVSFRADVTCKYSSSQKEVIRVTPGESIKLPDSDRINGDKSKLQSIDINVKGMELDKCTLSVYLEGSDPTESAEESDTDEAYDFMEDTEDNEEESEVENASESPFREMAEKVASGDNYEEAISKLKQYREENKALMAAEIVDALENDTEIPELVEEFEDSGDEQKLSSALVTQLVRELITRCENVDDLIFAIDSSRLRSNMMIYDEPHPDQALSYFVADLKDAEENGEVMDVPEYCGLKKAVRNNLSTVKVDSDDPFEETGFESADAESGESDSGSVSMDTDMGPEGIGGESGEPAAATPGAQAEMSDDGADEEQFGSAQTGMTPVDDIVDKLVEARSLEEAVMSLNMTAFYKIEIPDGVDADREENEYTIDEIIGVLERERGNPTGRHVDRLKHMEKLDKNLLPAVRSVVVSEAIDKSSRGMISGVLSEGELGQVIDDLRGLAFNGNDKIAALDSNYQVDTIQFSTIPSFISDIERGVREGSGVQSALQGIPVDGGIRKEVMSLKVNSEEERVTDFS